MIMMMMMIVIIVTTKMMIIVMTLSSTVYLTHLAIPSFPPNTPCLTLSVKGVPYLINGNGNGNVSSKTCTDRLQRIYCYGVDEGVRALLREAHVAVSNMKFHSPCAFEEYLNFELAYSDAVSH